MSSYDWKVAFTAQRGRDCWFRKVTKIVLLFNPQVKRSIKHLLWSILGPLVLLLTDWKGRSSDRTLFGVRHRNKLRDSADTRLPLQTVGGASDSGSFWHNLTFLRRVSHRPDLLIWWWLDWQTDRLVLHSRGRCRQSTGVPLDFIEPWRSSLFLLVDPLVLCIVRLRDAYQFHICVSTSKIL